MSLVLHSHPFASYCHKVLVALYDSGTPFEAVLVDLGNEASRDAFLKLNPTGKMPALQDGARGQVLTESSIIIEYLTHYYPGPVPLIPSDPELAREARFLDRFYDLYVGDPMQKIVGDRLRPDGQGDAFGVQQAHASLRSAYAMIESRLGDKTWELGDRFSIAECSAAPALYYANLVEPFGSAFPKVSAYLKRLSERPSYARVQREAAPFAHYFPKEK